MSTAAAAPLSAGRGANGGAPARRAVVRWAWRLFVVSGVNSSSSLPSSRSRWRRRSSARRRDERPAAGKRRLRYGAGRYLLPDL